MSEARCNICGAYFRGESMVGEKCKPCSELYPHAKTAADIKVKTENKAKTFDEDRAREIVYEILEEAGLKRNECDKCGKKFFRNNSMQKTCSLCKAAESKQEVK